MTGPGDFRRVFDSIESLYCPDTGECLWNDGRLDRKYFRSEHWLGLRRKKLEQVDYRCEVCGEFFQWGIPGLRPRIHHLSYSTLGREVPEEDCIAVCEDCHRAEHSSVAEMQLPVMTT